MQISEGDAQLRAHALTAYARRWRPGGSAHHGPSRRGRLRREQILRGPPSRDGGGETGLEGGEALVPYYVAVCLGVNGGQTCCESWFPRQRSMMPVWSVRDALWCD